MKYYQETQTILKLLILLIEETESERKDKSAISSILKELSQLFYNNFHFLSNLGYAYFFYCFYNQQSQNQFHKITSLVSIEAKKILKAMLCGEIKITGENEFTDTRSPVDKTSSEGLFIGLDEKEAV